MNFNLKEIFLIFIRGFLMGSADTIPGVSGGTIALITGIYERLIHAISSIKFGFIKPLLKLDFKELPNIFFLEIERKMIKIIKIHIVLQIIYFFHLIYYLKSLLIF